jgi:ribonuclease Z
LELVELEPGQILERAGYRIVPVGVEHRGPAFAFVLYEDERPGQFDPEVAVRLGLTPGPEFGLLQRGETVRGVSPEQVLGPARPGRKLVLSGDTAPCEAVGVASYRADLLVHEATFAAPEIDRAAETGHSTAAQAARLAAEADVRMLALTHMSTRYPVGVLMEEAQAIFAATVIPRDFDTIDLPFAERGDPKLVRWEHAPPAVRSPEPESPAATSPEHTSPAPTSPEPESPAPESPESQQVARAMAEPPG